MNIIQSEIIRSYYGTEIGRYDFDLKNNCDIKIILYLICNWTGGEGLSLNLSNKLVDPETKIFGYNLVPDVGEYVGRVSLGLTPLIPCRVIKETIINKDCDYPYSFGRAWDSAVMNIVKLRQVYHRNTHP